MPQRYRNVNKRLNELLATSQNKSYFVGAVTVIFIVIMAMVGIIPAYSAFTFQNEENGKRDILIEKLKTKLATSQALSKEYDNKIDLVEYFAKSFPNNADQQGIVELINSMVNENSSFLDKITFNRNPTPAFLQLGLDAQIKSQQVSITVQGSQSSLLNIVKQIEQSRRILNIASITIDRKPQEQIDEQGVQNGEYVLNAQLEYYFFDKTL
jgi:Tfp pilus assembly protein PilO